MLHQWVWETLEARVLFSGGLMQALYETAGLADATVKDTAQAPDGKQVVLGDDGRDVLLWRFNADGSRDESFGRGGMVRIDFMGGRDVAAALAVQSDGRIVVAGSAQEPRADLTITKVALARVEPDGSLDPTFGAGGKVLTGFGVVSVWGGYAGARGLAIQADGRIVVSATATVPPVDSTQSWDAVLLRYNADGTPDSSFADHGQRRFDLGGVEEAHGVLIMPDGRIVMGIDQVNPDNDLVLVRVGPDGRLDRSFGVDGISLTLFSADTINMGASRLAMQPDGKVLAMGSWWQSGGPARIAIVRYDAAGQLDPSFAGDGIYLGEPGVLSVRAGVDVLPDGTILFGASGYQADHAIAPRLQCISADGTVDTTFGDAGIMSLPGDFISEQPTGSSYRVALGADGRPIFALGLGDRVITGRAELTIGPVASWTAPAPGIYPDENVTPPDNSSDPMGPVADDASSATPATPLPTADDAAAGMVFAPGRPGFDTAIFQRRLLASGAPLADGEDLLERWSVSVWGE